MSAMPIPSTPHGPEGRTRDERGPGSPLSDGNQYMSIGPDCTNVIAEPAIARHSTRALSLALRSPKRTPQELKTAGARDQPRRFDGGERISPRIEVSERNVRF